MRIAECILHETLYESNSTRVYRAHHEATDRRVIVKQARIPRRSLISRLRREYRLAVSIDDQAVVAPLAFEDDIEFPGIIYADFGGVALSKILGRQREERSAGVQPSIPAFLDLAIQLARILRVVHASRIVHQDVKPANFICNPDSGEVRLTDFGIAVRGDGGLMPSLRMRGTLAYMAPEQSGRMNRPIDHRADLYSLGVTLYEAAVGRLPFEISDDVLEMIHRHIAVRPLDPHLVAPEFPGTLSAIVMKLLAKDPEDRYQSAAGLLADFEECRRQWRQNQSIAPFMPGQRDVSGVFAVSSKLYGREREKDEMIQAFRRVVSGAREFCLIRGFAGIGKSSVAFGLQDAVLESRGYFVAGKFDQYQLGIPYSGILKAFRQLINEILKEPPEELEAQKGRLRSALGANGRVLIEVIPEMERVIGVQPELAAVGPEEAENRFISVFQDFVRLLARPDRPLVLFVDDLHWADAASLRLLRVLLTAPEIRHLMILGAYRDNEVRDAGHPLTAAIEELRQRDVRIAAIQVEALDVSEINYWIAATLQSEPARSEELANFVHQKTGGNPFFVREFLLNLHRNGHIRFDEDLGGWTWDAGRISSLPAPDQIGELMAQKIQHLDLETREALQYAACLGNRFERGFLAGLLERDEEQVAAQLQPALREGLVSPLLAGADDRIKDPEATLEISQSEKHYQFQHDRVQQAAYDSLVVEQRESFHLRIAREWIRRSEDSPDLLDENIFAVIHHLDASANLVRQAAPEIREQTARLYLRGGRRALDSVAYQAAADALAAGMDLLPPDAWSARPDLIRDLMVTRAEAEHLCSRNEECIELIQQVLQSPGDAIEKIRAYEIYIRALNALGQMESLLETSLKALASLNVKLPPNPGPAGALFAILKTQALIRIKGPESILKAPEMRDPRRLAAMRILALFASGAFKTRPDLYAVAMCRYAEITYRGGPSPAAAYGLMSMAVILASIGRHKWSVRLSDIALRLLTKNNDHSAKTLFARVVFVMHWVEGLEAGFETFREANRLGVANGDIEYGGYSSLFLSVYRMYSTGPLSAVEPEVAASYELVRNFRNANVLYATRFFYQLILKLRDPSGGEAILSGKVFDRESGLERLQELNLQSEINLYYGAEALYLFLMGRRLEAFAAIEESQRRKKYVRAMYFVPHGDYVEAFIRFSVLDSLPAAERAACLKNLKAPMRRLRKLSRLNPDVYLHKWHLLNAEQARVVGDHEKAALFYNRAIETANARGYLLDEALACELAAEYYMTAGNDRIAGNYIEDARRVYSRWGAQAKVRQLEERHPRFFSDASAATPDRATLESTIAFATRSPRGDLDIDTVTKAVQMLFAGQDAGAVMDEFLRLSVENAGAQRGALILRRSDRLWLEAARDLNAPEVDFRAQPFDSYVGLPREVIHYVLHTGKPVVLADAREAGDFAADPYLRRSRCKSVLATPVVYQSDVQGVLYLENRLAAKVFTQPRLQILSVLSHQAAVSLENARLYEHMQSEISAKTRELLNLKLARDRMDPHFLFNSLNMVLALMRKDPETANRALAVLAELYETLTGISSEELVDFEREWRFLEEFLSLMQLRYANSLEIEVNRPDELPRFQIPPLTLQPIVENSFKHGFKHSTDTMRISVELETAYDRVHIRFRDNGSGFEREIRPGDTLHSISERLRHYFPAAALHLAGPSEVLVTIHLGRRLA